MKTTEAASNIDAFLTTIGTVGALLSLYLRMAGERIARRQDENPKAGTNCS